MYYVNPANVMSLFVKYLEEYNTLMIPIETAIDELQDALDSAECYWIENVEGGAE